MDKHGHVFNGEDRLGWLKLFLRFVDSVPPQENLAGYEIVEVPTKPGFFCRQTSRLV